MKAAKTNTPLQQAGISPARVQTQTLSLSEVGSASVVRLHSLAAADAVASAITTSGVHLPFEVNHSLGVDPIALCLRPNEWLIFSEHLEASSLLQRLEPALNCNESTVLDLSDGLATLRLVGTGAPWLLSKLSGLDFLSMNDAGQHCARTRIVQAAVVVHYHPLVHSQSEFAHDLIFDRSITRYLWKMLMASAPHADELARSIGKAL